MKKKKGGKLKWILLAVIVIVVLGTIFGGGDDTDTNTESAESDKKTEAEIEYTKVSASTLSEALDKNAAKASKEYKGKYLEISGELGNIDSDMSYICVTAGELDFTNIQCYLQNEEQENTILNMEAGDDITVKGKCTDVGEVLGYSINIESIE